MNPIRYMRYKTEAEKRSGRLQDTGTRRAEHEQEQREKHRQNVYAGSDVVGCTQLVSTDLGEMHEACVKLDSVGMMSLGTYDTREDATDAVVEWWEG